MSSIVFILGAGASVESGAPSMWNFLDVAANLLLQGKVDHARGDFETVFKVIGHLQRVHSKSNLDLINIESIFTALELGKVIQAVPGLDVKEIPFAIASLKRLIVETLEQTIVIPTRKGSIYPPPAYAALAQFIRRVAFEGQPRQTVSIITFNYDVSADIALVREGLQVNYHLHPTEQGISLLKLHGSLNWASTTSGDILPVPLDKYVHRYQGDVFEERAETRLTIGSNIHEVAKTLNVHPDVEPEPVIVPPTWNKAQYHGELSHVWSAAARHLSEAEYIYVCGYSLPETDAFFRLLYALGSVGGKPLKEFDVFNPDQIVAQRFLALLGPGAQPRFKYHTTPFSAVAGLISHRFR
jgi:hypothetical protein